MTRTEKENMPSPAGLDALDPLLQHRTRLGTLVLLSSVDAMSFTKLKASLQETDGNLGAQLKKLEDVGYLAINKEFIERKPVTWYTLTKMGHQALRRHMAGIEKLIKQVDAAGGK